VISIRVGIIIGLLNTFSACGHKPLRDFQCTNNLQTNNPGFAENAEFEALLDRGVAEGLPGVGLLVHDPQLGYWAGTRGMADFASHTPLAPCNRFQVGSITKTFTAAAIMRLVEQGRLGIDDRLSARLPQGEWKNVENADEATIGQLLNHTTGIFDFSESTDFKLTFLNDPRRAFTPHELVQFAAGQPALFAAGSAFSYSSTNYELLGLVVGAISGEDPTDFIAQQILAPLGLEHTTLASSAGQDPAGTVSCYSDFHGEGTLADVTDWWLLQLALSGGVISTLPDLTSFLDHLLAGDLLSQDSLAQMQAWHVFTSSEQQDWRKIKGGNTELFDAYGLGLIHSAQFAMIGHSGDTFGSSARLYRFENSDRTVVMFSNARVDEPYLFGDLFGNAVKDGLFH